MVGLKENVSNEISRLGGELLLENGGYTHQKQP